MKIVATADVHEDINLIKKLIKTVKYEKPDLVVLLGDVGNFGEFPKGLISLLKKYISPYRIIFVPGNHETPDLLEFFKNFYGIRTLHNKVMEYKDFIILGIGGGNVPPFMVSENEIEEFLNYVKNKLKNIENKKIIIFSHLHPEGTKSSLIAEGSNKILEFIYKYKPLLVIHGHIHETGGLEEIINKTKIVNTARNVSIIEIKDKNVNIKWL